GRATLSSRATEYSSGAAGRKPPAQRWPSPFGSGADPGGAPLAGPSPAGTSPRYEIRLKLRDGREVPVGVSFRSLRSGEGEAVGLIGVCQDLSSIKRMEERVRQADRLATIGRLAANIPPEIPNPPASLSPAIHPPAPPPPPPP